MKTIKLNWNNHELVEISKLNILCGISGDNKLQLFQRYTSDSPIKYIDMPENGLTQRGQFAKGVEIALDASELDSDQHIIIETHSSHILNAIRIAVMEDVIHCSDIRIYFITRIGENTTKLYQPSIDEYGCIDEWPNGFFDQEEKELAQILSGGRKKKHR